MAWYDNPINDLFNRLVKYVNGDVEGIVEYLASLVGPVDDFKCKAIGTITLIIVILLVVHNNAKIFTSITPTRFKDILNCIMKGKLDE